MAHILDPIKTTKWGPRTINPNTPTCPGCGAPTSDTTMCRRCTNTAHENLNHIAYLARWLDQKRARWTSNHPRHNATSRSATAPTPYDPRVTETSDRLLATLNKWAKTPTTNPGVAALQLTQNLDHIATDPNSATLYQQLQHHREQLESLFDRPPDRLYLGTCNHENCTQPLYAEPNTNTTTCTHCATTHNVQDRRETILEALYDYQATIRELTQLRYLIGEKGTSERMLYRYTQNGLLPQAGKRLECNRRGEYRNVPTYRIGDVPTAVTQWADRPKSPRKR